MTDSAGLPSGFSGRVRLFPLPNFVMFPQVVQALRVFEPRYVSMFQHALADDQLLAMASLLPGWEGEYEGRPPIAPEVCVGRIITHTALPDGTYNFLLAGVSRARVVRELPPEEPYRVAEVSLVPDEYSPEGGADRSRLLRLLEEAFRRWLPHDAGAAEHLEQLFGSRPSLGLLTDLVAYTLELPLGFRRQLLAEPRVERRGEMLLEAFRAMEAESPEEGGWPPDFSSN